jgi:hypothetical protein
VSTYLHVELLLERLLVVVADHQGPDLVQVLGVDPQKAAALRREAPLVQAGHVEVDTKVVDAKVRLGPML